MRSHKYKWRKASLVKSAGPSCSLSACNSAAATGRIFMKLISATFTKIYRQLQIWLNRTKMSGTLNENLSTLYIVDCSMNYVVAREPSLVSMATLNSFILLTTTCRSTMQRDPIATISWQQWLSESTTLLRYTYIAYLLCFA